MRLRSCSKMATVEDLQAEFRSLSTDLKKQMESMELGIAARIKDVVLEHMAIMKEEITGRLDALEGRIVALEDRPPPSVPSDDLACNFVVYGLAESDDENVSEKVNNLLLGQLKIENVRVAEAVRKDKFNNNTCGVGWLNVLILMIRTRLWKPNQNYVTQSISVTLVLCMINPSGRGNTKLIFYLL